jgi:hypothetical protein
MVSPSLMVALVPKLWRQSPKSWHVAAPMNISYLFINLVIYLGIALVLGQLMWDPRAWDAPGNIQQQICCDATPSLTWANVLYKNNLCALWAGLLQAGNCLQAGHCIWWIMLIIGFEVAGNTNFLNWIPLWIVGNQTLGWSCMISAFSLKFSLIWLSWTILLDYSIRNDIWLYRVINLLA